MAGYSKTLTPIDISGPLVVKCSWLKDLFPASEAREARQVLVVEDENTTNWKFSLRKSGKKLFISQDTWHPFVVDKHAKVGDVVEFSRETDASGSACKYKIRVMKRVNLFGAIIG